MDASAGGSTGSGDKKDDNQNPKNALTSDQEVKLKAFFESCPHPDEAQCVQLAKELEIECEKVKLWFENKSQAKEKALMLEIAANAMSELVRLIKEKTLWKRSLYDVSGLVLVSSREDHHMNHQLLQPCEESSKYTLLVRSRGKELVDLILDSDQWANTFQTIVSKAETVAVVEVGAPEDRDGALFVMYEEMHILSPLVPSREFFFLRYCRQVETGVWVIVDVSIDSFQGRVSTYPEQKYPSGCMIREIADGKCEVTWIEHVKVEGSSKLVRLYGDLLRKFNLFGAKMWLFALQRKCEKNQCSSIEYIPTHANDKEMRPQVARKNLVELISTRMLKSFCRSLKESDKMTCYSDFVGDISDPYGIQFTLCNNEITNHSDDKVLRVVASIQLPFSPQTIFYFLSDESRRKEWDDLGFSEEAAYISIGDILSYNRISVLQSTNPHCKTSIVQECCIDPMGAYVVFAKFDPRDMDKLINGENCSEVSILPCGFMISRDGRFDVESPGRQNGSLLTSSFQICVGSVASLEDLDLQTVRSSGYFLMKRIENIKSALSLDEEID